LYKKHQRNVRLKNIIEATLKEERKYFMAFNEEMLMHNSDHYKTELQWTYFIGYLENNTSIYFFMPGSIYSCISFASAEIGNDNLEKVKGHSKKQCANP
jgi:hypothetical protein